MGGKNKATNKQKCLSVGDGDGKTMGVKNRSHSQCFLWSLPYSNQTRTTVSSLEKEAY